MTVTLNLVVIKSKNIEESVSFYEELGLDFKKEQHGQGPEHYACELNHLVFEIYPSLINDIDAQTRIGFTVSNVEKVINNLRVKGAEIITELTESTWGKRAVVQDPDGYKIELLES